VLNQAHLRRVLTIYSRYYNRGRPHASLGPGIPEGSALIPALNDRRIPDGHRVVAKPVLFQEPEQASGIEDDHVIVLNEAGLLRLITLYCSYYERSRTPLSLDKDTSIPRPVMPASDGAIVVAIPEVGGLHHRYQRRAA
jgi:hypothetical protein